MRAASASFSFPLLLLGLAACAPLIRPAPPVLNGTFTGLATDGRAVTITFRQTESTVTGHGSLAGEAFELSALTSPQGPLVLTFEGGGIAKGRVALSPDGQTATVHGLGDPVTLRRGGTPVAMTAGPFAGRFAAGRPVAAWLELQQSGKLLAGTGSLEGRPVAVVARITGPRKAEGSALFSDDSRSGLTFLLSNDGRGLVVRGSAGLVEMWRRP